MLLHVAALPATTGHRPQFRAPEASHASAASLISLASLGVTHPLTRESQQCHGYASADVIAYQLAGH